MVVFTTTMQRPNTWYSATRFAVSGICALLLLMPVHAQQPQPVQYNLETGRGTINGIAYTLSTETLNATFATKVDAPVDEHWWVNCAKDAMTDSKVCWVSRKTLRVKVEQGKSIWLYVGSNHFPGKTQAIRVDGHKSIIGTSGSDGDFSSGAAATILKQLTKGATVTTRHYAWPYTDAVDETFSLTGFNEAYAYAKWAVTKLK
jgi:invasion protein IalB